MRLFPTPAVLLAVIAAAVGLAACGSSTSSSSSGSGSGSGSGASASSGAAGTGSARRAKLTACLKQHGVNPPARPSGAGGGYGFGGGPPANGAGGPPSQGPGGPGGGGLAANPKFRAALQACGGGLGRGFGGAPRQAAIKKFVTCVNKHGYKLPQPNLTGKGSVFPAGIRTNAKFQKASRACQSLLAPRAPARSGAPPSA
jgi:hypothetical protein